MITEIDPILGPRICERIIPKLLEMSQAVINNQLSFMDLDLNRYICRTNQKCWIAHNI